MKEVWKPALKEGLRRMEAADDLMGEEADREQEDGLRWRPAQVAVLVVVLVAAAVGGQDEEGGLAAPWLVRVEMAVVVVVEVAEVVAGLV